MDEITDYVIASMKIVELRREATEALPKASKDLRTMLNLSLKDMECIWNISSDCIGYIEEGSDEAYISDRIIDRFYEISCTRRCAIGYNGKSLPDSPIFGSIAEAWTYWLKLAIDKESYTLSNIELFELGLVGTQLKNRLDILLNRQGTSIGNYMFDSDLVN